MAFIQSGEEGDVFNVSHAVGSHSANWWTDIMLVQYFIRNIYILNSESPGGWSYKLSASDRLELPEPNADFKNLSKTETWIRRFQNDSLKNGNKVYQDGRVDKMHGKVTPITHSSFTIFLLNNYFGGLVSTKINSENWQDWALKDLKMPSLLRGELNRNYEIL